MRWLLFLIPFIVSCAVGDEVCPKLNSDREFYFNLEKAPDKDLFIKAVQVWQKHSNIRFYNGCVDFKPCIPVSFADIKENKCAYATIDTFGNKKIELSLSIWNDQTEQKKLHAYIHELGHLIKGIYFPSNVLPHSNDPDNLMYYTGTKTILDKKDIEFICED
jgi:hypothetical protein